MSLQSIGPLYMDFPDRRLSDVGRWVEDLGYDTLFVGDHVLFYVDGLTAIAAMAGGTSRLKLGTAVYLLALRDPVLVARSLATLAMELPDRFVLGVGVGGDLPEEFEVLGIDVHQRGKRVDEGMQAIRAMLGGSHDLPRFEGAPAGGAPPMWVGGRSEAAARRAARLGDGFIPYLVTADQSRELRGQVEQEAAAIGRDLDGFSWAVDVHLSVDEDPDAALAAVRELRPYGLSDKHIDRFCIVGDPATCVEGLRSYVDAGADHLVLNFVCPPDQKVAQVELVASQVLPAIRS
jgi:alkanesulfonate monooxygenase SsuD/methylene tetrahydromethanopterin reductase-like flavin-dependent oxidoreductase (luciferase family)